MQNKKILHISTELVHSGAEKITYDLACFQKNLGYDVIVACVKDTRGEVGNWLIDKQINIYWIDLNYRHPIQMIKNVIRFISFVKKEKVDLIHAHQFHANVVGRLAKLFSMAKLVSTVHLVERRFRPWHFWFDSFTSFLCQKEICVSEAVKIFTAQKVFFIKKKLKTIYNGIDFDLLHQDDHFYLRKKINISEDDFLIGCIGRLNYQKGFDIAIETVAMLHQKNVKSHLVIVGDGPQKKYLEELVEKKKLKQFVHFMGYQSKVAPFFKCFDCFLMPSRFEGFGLVAAEALFLNVPVIASSVDSLPEIIEHQRTGLIVEDLKAESFAKAIKWLIENRKKVEEMTLTGQIRMKELFSKERMCQEYQKLYEEII